MGLALLSSLTKACKVVNDVVYTRLAINEKLLELVLFELQRYYDDQPYLCLLYKAIISICYYGLFRIGELVICDIADHTTKAKDVHVAMNKNKILVVLYTSKTHGQDSYPQKIKITGNKPTNRFFCPFKLMQRYMMQRGGFESNTEPFFVFKGKIPVTDVNVRTVLQNMLQNLGLDPLLYGTHSLCSGRAVDMFKLGYSISQIKMAGRWQSNAVFKYLKTL